MRRFLNLVRHALLPNLCPKCRDTVEESLLNLEDIRRQYRQLRPEMLRQKAVAPTSCDTLLAEPKDLRVQRIQRSYSRYGTRPVVEELLKRSLSTASRDPGQSLHLAELAQEAVKKIIGREGPAGGPKAIPDLNALARAHLGNACRLLRRFEEAEAHFRAALVFLVQGSGDPLVFGDVYSLYGSYLRCRREFKSALVVLEQADEVFLKTRSSRRRARILIQKAGVQEDLRDLEAAVRTVREALPLLTGEWSYSLKAAAYHNLAVYLCELGRSEEALVAYERGEDLFHRLPVPAPGTANYRRWTHGKVRWGLGELERAEQTLQVALEGFGRQQDHYRCALVSLDLAGVYAQQDRLAELVPLVEATYEGLKAYDLEPEAAQALQLLVQSAARHQLTIAVIRTVAEKLRSSVGCLGASR